MSSNARFRGYATNLLAHAIASYAKGIGATPTLAIVRPDFPVIGDSDILVRSRHGASGVILLTHELNVLEWSDGNGLYGTNVGSRSANLENYEVEKEVEERKKPYHRKFRGKSGSCPHCKQMIQDFDALGYWYGWTLGIDPPYWQELRLYVFRRDRFTCTACGVKYSENELQAHHIKPKEEMGTDSARNLTTLCRLCHKDTQPIYNLDT